MNGLKQIKNYYLYRPTIELLKLITAIVIGAILLQSLLSTKSFFEFYDQKIPRNATVEKISLEEKPAVEFQTNLSYLGQLELLLNSNYKTSETDSTISSEFELSKQLPPIRIKTSILDLSTQREYYNQTFELIPVSGDQRVVILLPEYRNLAAGNYRIQVEDISDPELGESMNVFAVSKNGNLLIDTVYKYNLFTAIGDPFNFVSALLLRYSGSFTGNQAVLILIILVGIAAISAIRFYNLPKTVKKSPLALYDNIVVVTFWVVLICTLIYQLYYRSFAQFEGSILNLTEYRFLNGPISVCLSTLITISFRYLKEIPEVIHLPIPNDKFKKLDHIISPTIDASVIAGIIALFLLIFIPSLGNSFESSFHTDKFSSYLPTVANMSSSRNPFSNSNAAYSNILSGSNDTTSFGTFPFYEWYLYPTYGISETLGLNVYTHLMVGVLGLLLIVGLYLTLKTELGRSVTTLFLLLLVTGPFFQLFSTITVLDLPAALLFVWGIYAFQRKLDQFASLLMGLAVIMKLSVISIVLPFAVGFIYYRRHEKLNGLISFAIISATPYFAFKFLVDDIPMHQNQGAIRLLLFILMIGVTTWLVPHIITRVDKVFSRSTKLIALSLMSLFGMVLMSQDIIKLASNFLPDPELLLSVDVYADLLSQTFNLVNPVVLPFFILGMFLAYKRPWFKLLIVSNLFYLAIAIKPLYFHIYYKHIFVFSLLLIACFGAVKMLQRYRFGLVLLLMLLITVPMSAMLDVAEYTNREIGVDLDEVSTYLSQNVQSHEKIIRSDTLTKNLVLRGDFQIINYLNLGELTERKAKQRIAEIGLGAFLKENNVKYLINVGLPEFWRFIYLLSEEDFNRTGLILNDDETIDINMRTKYEVIAREAFELETIITNVYIFKVVD